MKSTQEQHPWRATARTIFAVVVSFAAMWPVVIEAADLHTTEWAVASIAVSGAITRVMALPAVNEFLDRFLPFLAADPVEKYGE